MKQPLIGFTTPDFSGQSQTMFFVEGSQAAILVKRLGKRFTKRAMPLKTALAALEWCMINRTAFVFMPVAAARN